MGECQQEYYLTVRLRNNQWIQALSTTVAGFGQLLRLPVFAPAAHADPVEQRSVHI